MSCSAKTINYQLFVINNLESPTETKGDEDGLLLKNDTHFGIEAVVVAVHLLESMIVEPVETTIDFDIRRHGGAVVVVVHKETATETSAYHGSPGFTYGAVIHVNKHLSHVAGLEALVGQSGLAETIAETASEEEVLANVDTIDDVEAEGFLVGIEVIALRGDVWRDTIDGGFAIVANIVEITGFKFEHVLYIGTLLRVLSHCRGSGNEHNYQ